MKTFQLKDVSSWIFLAEGKAHLVVHNLTNQKYKGYVLRIPKVLDARSTLDKAEAELMFVENSITSWFAHQSHSEIVSLTPDFCIALIAAVAPLRPVGRTHVTELSSFAYLEQNLNSIPGVKSVANVSVEVKVKCGLKGSSPFIPMDRSIKLRLGRYKLMQLYKLSNQIKEKYAIDKDNIHLPEWGTFTDVSEYDPCDLCSGVEDRIEEAITKLFTNPQNNLKVSIQGRHVYGWNSSTTKEELRSELMKLNESLSFDSIVQTLKAVFVVDNTVIKLQRLQHLDLIDVEGCDVIFQRLEKLSGSREAAVETLKSELLLPLNLKLVKDINCALSDQTIPVALPNVIDKLLQLRVSEQTAEDDRQTHLTAALQLVESMDASECLLVLRLWMIALIAKDASVIVALDKAQPHSVESVDCLTSSNSYWSVKPQVHALPGTVMHHNFVDKQGTATPSSTTLSYSLHLVDVGLKSMKKFWTKNSEEASIICDCSLYEQHLCI